MWNCKNNLKYIYDWKTNRNAIFNDIYAIDQALTDPILSWLDSDKANLLDWLLMGDYGIRQLSCLTEDVLDDDEQLDTTKRGLIASIVYQKYADEWNRLYETLTADYDPLTNYQRTKVETPDDTITTDTSLNVKVNNRTYGFNDEESVNTSDTIQLEDDNTSNETKVHSGTITTEETGTQDMGANPSAFQDLLKQEVDTRLLYRFYDIVVKIVADVLTIKVI